MRSPSSTSSLRTTSTASTRSVAEDRDRRDEEAQHDPPRLALRARAPRTRSSSSKFLRARSRSSSSARCARGVELEVGRIDDHVGAGELAELLQLRRRERGLHRPAPAEHHDLLDPGRADRLDRLGRRVRRRELLRGEREHPGAVDRDVPVPDHDRPLVREVELAVLEVGVAVVPGDELGGRPRARQVLAGDAEPPVGLRADRVDDRVVEPQQLLVADGRSRPRRCRRSGSPAARGLLERARDGLDVLVVGRDAEPDEAPGRRQPLDQVDLDRRLLASSRASAA